jgi:hypothetical protein
MRRKPLLTHVHFTENGAVSPPFPARFSPPFRFLFRQHVLRWKRSAGEPYRGFFVSVWRLVMHRSLRLVVAFAACILLAQQAEAQESKAAQATRKKLKQKITVEFKEIGTRDVFSGIRDEMDKPVNFKIDNSNGLSNNSKLTYKAKNKTVEQVLNELSDKFDFGWIVVSNPSNNKVDGWVIIRRTGKKERGYEAGKEPKKSSAAPLPERALAGVRPAWSRSSEFVLTADGRARR